MILEQVQQLTSLQTRQQESEILWERIEDFSFDLFVEVHLWGDGFKCMSVISVDETVEGDDDCVLDERIFMEKFEENGID